MGFKFNSTGTVTLAAGDNIVIVAPNPATDGLGEREHFIRRMYVERVDDAAVTLIFKNNAAQPREIMPRITLNSDKGAVWLDLDSLEEIGVGGGLALVVNASVGNKASIYIEYRIGTALNWPA